MARRLYELARRGETIARPARKITIYALSLARVRERASRGARSLVPKEPTCARCARISEPRSAVRPIWERLLRDASGPFVLYESLHARRYRSGAGSRADRTRARHPISDDRSRWAWIGGLSARDASCRCRRGPHRSTSSCAIRRARSSASGRPWAPCSRHGRSSCEDPPRTRDARDGAAARRRHRIFRWIPPRASRDRADPCCVCGDPGFRAAAITFRNHPATLSAPRDACRR